MWLCTAKLTLAIALWHICSYADNLVNSMCKQTFYVDNCYAQHWHNWGSHIVNCWHVSCICMLIQTSSLLVTDMLFLVDRFIILSVSLVAVTVESKHELCVTSVQSYTAGFVVILSLCALVEISVAWVSILGTIIHAEPRTCMPYFVYGRLGKNLFILFEARWITRSIWKMLGPFATASRRYIASHQMSLVACQL